MVPGNAVNESLLILKMKLSINIAKESIVLIMTVNMKHDCHIFSKCLACQMKNLVFQSKYLAFRLKTLDFG